MSCFHARLCKWIQLMICFNLPFSRFAFVSVWPVICDRDTSRVPCACVVSESLWFLRKEKMSACCLGGSLWVKLSNTMTADTVFCYASLSMDPFKRLLNPFSFSFPSNSCICIYFLLFFFFLQVVFLSSYFFYVCSPDHNLKGTLSEGESRQQLRSSAERINLLGYRIRADVCGEKKVKDGRWLEGGGGWSKREEARWPESFRKQLARCFTNFRTNLISCYQSCRTLCSARLQPCFFFLPFCCILTLNCLYSFDWASRKMQICGTTDCLFIKTQQSRCSVRWRWRLECLL